MTAAPGQKYVAYYRVSTKQQGDSGLGLDAQRTYIEHFYQGRDIIAEFTDVRSGKDVANRPELNKALDLCKKQGAILVVAKIDRLSRNTEQALKIYRELDGRLEACDVPTLDKFTLTLFMAIADRERELIGIRTKGALVERKKRTGEWRQGSTPFKDGSATVKATGILKDMARSNENNQRATRLIIELVKDGKSCKEIATELNNSGYKTSRGGRFKAIQVERLYNRHAESASGSYQLVLA
jgi:DNA invertase Pin-like site-specific DNA recombinase